MYTEITINMAEPASKKPAANIQAWRGAQRGGGAAVPCTLPSWTENTVLCPATDWAGRITWIHELYEFGSSTLVKYVIVWERAEASSVQWLRGCRRLRPCARRKSPMNKNKALAWRHSTNVPHYIITLTAAEEMLLTTETYLLKAASRDNSPRTNSHISVQSTSTVSNLCLSSFFLYWGRIPVSSDAVRIIPFFMEQQHM